VLKYSKRIRLNHTRLEVVYTPSWYKVIGSARWFFVAYPQSRSREWEEAEDGERIYLSSPHMSDEGYEMQYIQEALIQTGLLLWVRTSMS